MKKLIIGCVAMACMAGTLQAQTIEEGRKALYYGKNQTARNIFQRQYASNSKDPQAIYWLGQSMLDADDVEAAKNLYQTALQSGVNDPYLWVGMGHVTLLEGGDAASARQKFEQAITSTTSTKGRNKGQEDVGILLAISRANADGNSQVGDPVYGAEKAKRAAEIDPKNAEAPLLAGVNYLKMSGDKGGEAVVQFTEAANRNPLLAEPLYRIGRIYQSQDNKESMDNYYARAIAADASYAPTYFGYYQYYEERDVNAAKQFLDKFVQNSDQDCQTDYFQANYLFRAGQYQASLDKANQMVAGNCASYPRVNILFAYNYQRLGQYPEAANSIGKFFRMEKRNAIQPSDYQIAANIYKMVPGFEDSAVLYLETAMNIDTARKNKMMYADTIARIYRMRNMPQKRLEWLQKSAALNNNLSNLDIYNLGDAALTVKNYRIADSMFTIYKQKYPEQIYGYLGAAKSAQAQDSTMASAIIPTNEYITFLEKEPAKYKSQLIYQYSLLAQYYANTAKDFNGAISQFEKILAVDPANADAAKYRDILIRARDKAKNPSAPKRN